MHRQITRSAPRRALLAAGLLASLAVAVPAATPAPERAMRAVTFTLNGAGTATWSIDWPNEKGQEAIRYTWRGTFRFNVPARVLKNPAKARFNVRSRGTLVGGWTGVLNGTVLDGFAEGPYKCDYKGANVPAPVSATLSNGQIRGKLLLTLRARSGSFFPSSGNGATIDCISAYGRTAPPHFDPSWLFRDTVTHRGRLTRDTAIISIPSKVLPRGKAKIGFPYEVGARDSNFTGNTRWRNRGVVNLRVR
jgi:hypothetical protein